MYDFEWRVTHPIILYLQYLHSVDSAVVLGNYYELQKSVIDDYLISGLN